MPNWCSTSIVFYGDRDCLSFAYEELIKALSTVDVGDFGWLGRWLVYKNLDGDILDDKDFHVRGFVQHVDLNDVLRLESSDAWSPCHEFYALFASYYALDYELAAYEPGNSLFITTDINHRFFTEDCVVDVFLDDGLEQMPMLHFLSTFEPFTESKILVEEFSEQFPNFDIATVDDIIMFLAAECKLMGLDPASAFQILPIEYVQKLFRTGSDVISPTVENKCKSNM